MLSLTELKNLGIFRSPEVTLVAKITTNHVVMSDNNVVIKPRIYRKQQDSQSESLLFSNAACELSELASQQYTNKFEQS